MKKSFSISLDTELFREFSAACRRKAINKSALINSLIQLWLDHQDDAPKVETFVHDPSRDL